MGKPSHDVHCLICLKLFRGSDARTRLCSRECMSIKIYGKGISRQCCRNCKRTYKPRCSEYIKFCSRACSFAYHKRNGRTRITSGRCKHCQAVTEGFQHYCPRCRRNMQILRSRVACEKQKQKKREEHHEVQMKLCLFCATPFKPRGRQKHCSRRCCMKFGNEQYLIRQAFSLQPKEDMRKHNRLIETFKLMRQLRQEIYRRNQHVNRK